MSGRGTHGPAPRPGVLAINPYVPGRSTASGGIKTYKLSSNESPLGPSPLASAAFREACENLERYPDGSATALREALAQRHGLNPDHIVCGSGSDEILSLLAQAYLRDGDEAIYSEHGFLVYPIVIKANGATAVVAPERNYTADVDAILARANNRTRVVFLANPNNPTGTYLPFDEVRRLHSGLQPSTLLVLDAAYAEYVRRNNYESGIELVATSNNVVMVRTFSKIYGLAGARLGWAYGPEHVVDALNRIRGAFNINAAALAAGVAALHDDEHLQNGVSHNERWLPWLSKEIAGLGLKVIPSVGNFILIIFRKEHGGAPAADEFLLARGIVLRRMEVYGLPDALRLTIGTEEANSAVVEALRIFVGKPGPRHG